MDIVRQIEIKASVESVYKAITSPEGVKGWWSQNSAIARKEGGEHVMNFLKEGHEIVMKFKVDEISDRKVKWTCTENGNPAWVGTSLVFEFGAENGHTQLTFSHIGWKEQFKDTPLYVSVQPTWTAFMNSLKSYCESGVGQPW